MLDLRSSCFVLFLAASASPALAGVWVVGGAQATHPDVNSALASSVDGDVILVRDASVAGFVIDGQAVTVIGETSAHVQLTSSVEIKNLSAGESAVLAHFACTVDTYGAMLRTHDNAGSVRVQDCQFLAPTFTDVHVTAAAQSDHDADVAFVRTDLRGGPSFAYTGAQGGPGARMTNSSAAFYDCTLTGGAGSSGHFPFDGFPQSGAPGRNAIEGLTSTLFFSGSTLTGGRGGNGLSLGVGPPACQTPYLYPTSGGPGGQAIVLAYASVARVRDSALIGGAGGTGGVDPCNNPAGNGATGLPYTAILGAPANYDAVPGLARKLVAPALVRASTVAQFSFDGVPGDRVYLLSKTSAAHVWTPSVGATLLVQGPFRRNFLGVVPMSGRLDVTLPIPALGVGLLEDQRHLQCVLIDAGGVGHGGSNAVLTMIDPSY